MCETRKMAPTPEAGYGSRMFQNGLFSVSAMNDAIWGGTLAVEWVVHAKFEMPLLLRYHPHLSPSPKPQIFLHFPPSWAWMGGGCLAKMTTWRDGMRNWRVCRMFVVWDPSDVLDEGGAELRAFSVPLRRWRWSWLCAWRRIGGCVLPQRYAVHAARCKPHWFVGKTRSGKW